MWNFNIESKMLIWIWMFFLIQVSDTLDNFSDRNRKYCYNNNNPNYCALCGCYQTGITQHSLSCGVNEVIRMESRGHPMKTRPYDHTEPLCVLTEEKFCKSGFRDTKLVTTLEDRVAVYKLCTLQNTCTFTVKSVDSGDAKLVRYPYVCEEKFLSMSNSVSLQVTDPVLYFTGKDHVGEYINCGCTVTPSSQQTMELEIFYINGDNMCNRVTFNSLDVIQCTNDTQLYTSYETQYNITFLNIMMNNITATDDDVLYFKVYGNNVRVICSGCLKKTDLTTSINNQQINQEIYISKEECERKLNKTYELFGGISTALIIINIVCIGIYCFITRRTDKLSNVPNQSVSTNAEADFHPGTESPHYHELDDRPMYLTVTG